MKEEKITAEKKKSVKKKKTAMPQNDLFAPQEQAGLIEPDTESITVTESNEANSGKRLATEKHPTIESVVNGLFKFTNMEDAVAKLNTIKEHFVISAKLPKDENENTVKLWIRGFQIDDEEEKEGFLGNYALIKIKEEDNKFSLIAEKQKIALKYHPQRKRPKRKHPDWGHPCMRVIKKGTVFENTEAAQKVLNQLHEEHPLVSIPAVNKLYVILYSKAYNPPIKKFVLEIKPAEGGFIIESKENNYVKKDQTDVKPQTEEKPKNTFVKNNDKTVFSKKPDSDKAKSKQAKPQHTAAQVGNFSNRITIPTQ